MKNFRKHFFITSAAAISFFILSFNDIDKNLYTVAGRTEMIDGNIALISPASSVTFGFKGDRVDVSLRAQDDTDHHNYVVLELDGQYYGRFKVTSAGTKLNVYSTSKKPHTLTVYKATEAAIGTILFKEAIGTIMAAKVTPKKKIEFIGDSITVGMGNDTAETPCGNGSEWYDQHNAYYSYAPIAARELKADYVVNAVSGIGMYRNWNDEHKDQPTMPQVYENLYLNRKDDKKYDFGFAPDVTCIALGTNDFSNGDGKKARLPFNEKEYVDNYVAFINTVYKHSPKTQIILLNSPMVTGEKSETFKKCLEQVKETVNKQAGHKPVVVFTFKDVTPTGCGSHPAIEEDKAMAAQLAPFLKTYLK
ncbi:GDSL family lipase [Flavobacterium akiainvivens]|uniref:GDSL family lipase n=1 Tax=Flavobacterium akiainvivens TaxID=1202724 RepID=A0A0M8MCE7_9FLAO|nr:SGNH/GDSL hydrolase family protein [Flavobacterium akiainvivens]KOS05864.1 GDSL family lipase [Flavobacterium akiainvivens]SFQ56595.1 GDSL-like Lipase/Acylhydrolase family protein [Flavobacterium akiainvivens]